MGLSTVNIWISDVADPCGTFKGEGTITILDCRGILEWPCGTFLDPNGKWQPVPNRQYHNLPFRCGHLEAQLPPGCYWAVCGYVIPSGDHLHFNYTTHVGIFEACCDKTVCVKLFNPTARLCWDWFHIGLRMLSLPGVGGKAPLDRAKVAEVQKAVEALLPKDPLSPVEQAIERIFDELYAIGGKQT